jgi:capsid protein
MPIFPSQAKSKSQTSQSSPPKRSQKRAKAAAPAAWNVRRFEAAETNRLNSAHWRKANDQSLNSELAFELKTLRARATFEISRNPILEGVVRDFANDVCGEMGPWLKVRTANDRYKAALEGLYKWWFRRPEISGQLSGADCVRIWVRRLLDSGEYLAQRVSRRVNPGPVAFRLKLLHPRRLDTPAASSSDPDVCLGVRRTRDGEPISYYISEPMRFGAYELAGIDFREYSAAQIIHRFITIEEEQARGYPWLAPSLPVTADVRDFDAQVLDACRAAADQAVVWYTDHPDSPYLEVNESTEVERRMQQTGPPGWKPMQMKPEQPSLNHVEYRSDRLREIGRPIGMPLMKIRLGSEQHNFASARFDNEIYKQGVRCVRAWLAYGTLEECVSVLQREGELYAAANPDWKYAALARRPDDVELSFGWQPLVAVDADKDAQDEERRLQGGTLTYEDACDRNGGDQVNNIQSIARTIRMYKDAGVPLPAWAEKWGDPANRERIAIEAAKNGSGKPRDRARRLVKARRRPIQP